ncbi:MAG: hypothetical protein ACR2GY_00095 [Phycisphaerales bacterium]
MATEPIDRHTLDQDQRRWSEERLTQFTADVGAIVAESPDIVAAWTGMAHAAWRTRMLQSLDAAGQSGLSDFAELLQSLALSPAERALVLPLEAQYLTDLDLVLEDFAKGYMAVEDRMFEIREALENQNPRAVAQRAEMAQWYRQLQKRVYLLNQEFAAACAAVLEPGSAARWSMMVGEMFNRPAYEASPVDLCVDALRDDAMLVDDKLIAITLLYDEYCSRRMVYRHRLNRAIESWTGSKQEATAMAQYEANLAAIRTDWTITPESAFADNPVAPLLVEWAQMERSITLRLKRVFSSDEFEALPPAIRFLMDWHEPPHDRQ